MGEVAAQVPPSLANNTESEVANRLILLANLVNKKSCENDEDNDSSKSSTSCTGTSGSSNGNTACVHEPEPPTHSWTAIVRTGTKHSSTTKKNRSALRRSSGPPVDDSRSSGNSLTQATLHRVSSENSYDGDDDSSKGLLLAEVQAGMTLYNPYRVKHEYADRANASIGELEEMDALDTSINKSNRGGVTMLFPEKLYQLLSLPQEVVDPAIVSWAPHGRCFSVHQPREFTRSLLPNYFNHNAITSFQRQLNLYGFKRITKAGSKDQGHYYHELFLRGRPELCRRMRRQKIKGTGHKPLPDPENEPDFYVMKPCYELNENEKNQKEICDSENTRLIKVFTEKRPLDSPAEGFSPMSKVSRRDSDVSESQSRKSTTQDKNWSKEKTSEAEFISRRDQGNDFTSKVFSHGSLDRSREINSKELRESMLHNGNFISQHLSSSVRQPHHLQHQLVDPMCLLQQQINPLVSVHRDCFLPSPENTVLLPIQGGGVVSAATHQQELILQELLARAAHNRVSAPELRFTQGASTMRSNEAALRTEIEVLEQTRRSIQLQQQRLQLLLDQAQIASTSRHLMQLPPAYESHFAALRGGITHLDDLERRALELSTATSSVRGGRVLLPSGGSGKHDIFGGTKSSNSHGRIADRLASSASESFSSRLTDLNNSTSNNNVGTVFQSLANLVGNNRLTNAQMDEIEALLRAQRAEKNTTQAPIRN